MAGKREKPEEIVSKVRQVEVLQGQGATIAEAVRQIGVTQQTFYRWRKLYGAMQRSQLARLEFTCFWSGLHATFRASFSWAVNSSLLLMRSSNQIKNSHLWSIEKYRC